MRLVYFLYCLSGFSALVYEIVWARELAHLLGASLYAVSTVTGLFLGGLALGAAWCAGYLAGNQWTESKCLKGFGLVEILVGLFGLAVPIVFAAHVQQPLWTWLNIAQPSLSYLARVAMAAVLIVPAAALIGATFPLVLGGVGGNRPEKSQWLYGFNALGAAAGSVAAGFVFLPYFGLALSSATAAAINLITAVAALALGKRAADKPNSVAAPLSDDQSGISLRLLLLVAFAVGALSLSFEICWMRLFALLLGSATYSLSCVLAIYLTGLALGSLTAARFLLRLRQPVIVASGALAVSALYCLVVIYLAEKLPWTFIAIEKYLYAVGWQQAFAVALAARLIVVALVILVPACASGAVLPLLFAAASGDAASASSRLFACNAAGCVAGAFLAGFFLIPQLGECMGSGLQATLLLGCLAGACLAWWLMTIWSATFIADRSTGKLVNGVIAVIILLVVADAAVFRPKWNSALMSAGASFYSGEEIKRITERMFVTAVSGAHANPVLFYRDGLNATIAVDASSKDNLLFLKSDGKVEAALPLLAGQPSPASDWLTHVELGILPKLVRGSSCRSTLVIGYGSGTTAGAVLRDPAVEDLQVVELEPAVYAADRCFSPANGSPLRSSRTSALTNDGRYVLESSTKLYDAIICQPSDPWVSGASELFSQEFFRLEKSRLAPNGVACQWVQLYAITPEYFGVLCRTFLNVFPGAMLFRDPQAGECILVGMRDGTPVRQSMPALDSDGPLPVRLQLDAGGLRRLCDRLAEHTHDAALNTDDNLKIEFATARAAMVQAPSIDENAGFIDLAK